MIWYVAISRFMRTAKPSSMVPSLFVHFSSTLTARLQVPLLFDNTLKNVTILVTVRAYLSPVFSSVASCTVAQAPFPISSSSL